MKSELREVLKLRRENMPKDEVLKKSGEICKRVINSESFKNAEIVMVYLSFANEVDTGKIVQCAIECGKTVLVPVTENDIISPCVLESLDGLAAGAYGIKEPKVKKVWQGKIDLCIIPGIGFDKYGGRMGFGKGCYDKFLAKTPCKKIGLAFETQIEENIYTEPTDIPMDIIVTEKEMVNCV